LLVPKRHSRERQQKRQSTREKIELAELRVREAEAAAVEERVNNQGRREELEIEQTKIAVGVSRIELTERRLGVARGVIRLAKDAAQALLWIVVATVLILAALRGPEPYTGLAIVCVLGGGTTINFLRGRSGADPD
jgi:hypothetical protein